MKQQLYARIQRIVEGKEQEQETAPPALTSSIGSHAQGKESHNSHSRTQGEYQDGEGSTQSEGHEGEGEGQDGEGSKVQDGEGSAQGHGQDGEGSTLGQGPDSHQRDRLSKLHRPTWVKELFFSLQTAQKLSLRLGDGAHAQGILPN